MVFVIRRRTRYLFRTISASDIKAVDPLNQGVNASILPVLNQYPHGNAPSFGEDGGLNFSGYRFNAPSPSQRSCDCRQIDVHLDRAAKHTLSVRGNACGQHDDQILAQLPGQKAGINPPRQTAKDLPRSTRRSCEQI